jgi:hypothetical protein
MLISFCTTPQFAQHFHKYVDKSKAARVKLSSTDHIGLLAHDIFNVSIPKYHIPLSEFVFQHGPAENDPMFGWGAGSMKDVDADGDANIADASAVWGVDGDGDANAAIGTWVRVNGGEPLGGERGEVEFTVVGYASRNSRLVSKMFVSDLHVYLPKHPTIPLLSCHPCLKSNSLRTANNTLTLIGSLQTDPFSPSHVPEATLSNPSAPYASPNKRRRIVSFDNSNDAAGTATWGASEPLEAQDTAWPSVHSLAEQSSRSTLPSTRTTDPTVPSESEGDLGEEIEVANTIIRKRAKAREAAQEEERAATFERERDTRERKEKKKKEKAKHDQVGNPKMTVDKGGAVVEKRKKKKTRVDGEA